MARRNDGVASRILLWFFAGLMVVATAAGIKFVLENDIGGGGSSSQIVTIPSEPPISSSEEPTTTEEPTTAEEPTTDEEPTTAEEPVDEILDPQPNGLYLLEFNKEILLTNTGGLHDLHVIDLYGGIENHEIITNKILFKPHIDNPNPIIHFIWFNDAGDVFEYDRNLMISDFQLGVNIIELSNDEATFKVTNRPFMKSDSIEVNEVDALNSLRNMDYYSHDMEWFDSLPPLAKNAYRSSDNYGKLVLQDNRYTYNSLKFDVETIVDGEYQFNKNGIKMGFPTVINETHTNDIFETGFNYISYILQDYTIKAGENELNYSAEQLRSKGPIDNVFRVYRSNVDLTWKKVPLDSDLVIEADGNYYQFGIVFATNNKSHNIVLYEFEL